MSNIMNFNFENQPVRVMMINGEPRWIAKDVCMALGINICQIRRLDDDEKGLHIVQTLGGKQEMAILSEHGLYNLILGSRKRNTKNFRRWVTHEVLPTIRRTGRYSVDLENVPLEDIDKSTEKILVSGTEIEIPMHMAKSGFSISVTKTGVVTFRKTAKK